MEQLDVGGRIRQLRKQKAMTQAQLAKIAKVSAAAVTQWESGLQVPKSESLTLIANCFGVSPAWLLTGVQPATQMINVKGFDNNVVNDDTKSHDLYFTKYSAQFGMGNGVPAELEHDEIIGQLGVSREWANRYLHKATAFNCVTLITGLGDSMFPTYSDGETLFLDESVKEVKLDAVYAFKYDDVLYIKRIQRQKGTLKVISDNKSYDTWTIEAHELANMRVIGRIIHGCRIFDI